MAIYNRGIKKFSGGRDDEGHREYRVTHLIETTVPYNSDTNVGDGPEAISGAPGLPAFGGYWNYGNDEDLWAFCHPQRSIRPFNQKDGEKVAFWLVESLFSTKPLNRCMTDAWGDPLLEPQKVSGNSVKYTIEAMKDRNGDLFVSSSHEMFRGPQVEVDSNRHSVRIEQNVSTLQLDLCTSMVDSVSDDELWGVAARRIKLSDFSWEEKWYGTCTYYYTRVFFFDVRNKDNDLFDRTILDEGTKVLSGKWRTSDCEDDAWVDVNVCDLLPDSTNPQHFIRYKDQNDENARVILNGAGKPAYSLNVQTISPGSGITGTGQTGEAAEFVYEYYPEADFTLLGIPTDIDFGTGTPD